jgi:hypothetical protein
MNNALKVEVEKIEVRAISHYCGQPIFVFNSIIVVTLATAAYDYLTLSKLTKTIYYT